MTDSNDWRPHLAPKERLLWSGRPSTRPIILRPIDALLILGSIIWGITAVPTAVPMLSSDAPITFLVIATTFLAAALYFTVGRFLVDWAMRAETFYAVTNERVFIRSRTFGSRMKTLPIGSGLAIESSEKARGFVRFGPSATFFSARWGFAVWHGGNGGFEFRHIGDPQAVASIVRGIQRDAG